jgi:hypothetical protein
MAFWFEPHESRRVTVRVSSGIPLMSHFYVIFKSTSQIFSKLIELEILKWPRNGIPLASLVPMGGYCKTTCILFMDWQILEHFIIDATLEWQTAYDRTMHQALCQYCRPLLVSNKKLSPRQWTSFFLKSKSAQGLYAGDKTQGQGTKALETELLGKKCKVLPPFHFNQRKGIKVCTLYVSLRSASLRSRRLIRNWGSSYQEYKKD